MPKTTIILPTYNEAPNLPLMVEALFALGIPDLHILVVDDSSPDGTGQIAEDLAAQYGPKMRVVHKERKEGLGPAYKVGFRHALADGSEYMIQMDTDFSHRPQYVPDLIARADAGADVVLGSRYVKGGGVDESWGWFRKLLSWFANRVYVSVILGLPVTDATGGFRLWKRDTIIGMGMDRVKSNGYVFQVEIAYVAHKLGYKMVETPIYFPDRERGDSKMGRHIILEAAIRTWQIRKLHHGLNPSMRRTSDAVPAAGS